MQLVFDIQSYWLAGTGSDAGAYADNLAAKDSNKLPYLPAKTQKGQIREAFWLAEKSGWFKEFQQRFDVKLTEVLFGTESRDGKNGQGVLQFTNAQLSDNEIAFFLASGNKELSNARRNCLFTLLNSTAINQDGSAEANSLRSYEVAIPMTLQGEILAQTQHLNEEVRLVVERNLSTWLHQVLPLVTHIGAKKQRGLGEVAVSLIQEEVA